MCVCDIVVYTRVCVSVCARLLVLHVREDLGFLLLYNSNEYYYYYYCFIFYLNTYVNVVRVSCTERTRGTVQRSLIVPEIPGAGVCVYPFCTRIFLP